MQGKITTWSGEAYMVTNRRMFAADREHRHCIMSVTCFFPITGDAVEEAWGGSQTG